MDPFQDQWACFEARCAKMKMQAMINTNRTADAGIAAKRQSTTIQRLIYEIPDNGAERSCKNEGSPK